MQSIRLYYQHTPRVWMAIVGLASALMVLEIQRMPVASMVSFSMFAPLPYVLEALVLICLGVIYSMRPQIMVTTHSGVRLLVAVLAVLATWGLLGIASVDDGISLLILIVYRMTTGLFVVLWGERVCTLGARRAAFTFASACLLSGCITLGLSFLPEVLARVVLVSLPLLSGVMFVLYRPRSIDIPKSEEGGFTKDLPRFPFTTMREKVIAVGLILLPIICRGPIISSQVSWIGLQSDSLVMLMQFAIGCGVALAGVIIFLIVMRVWNGCFILVYELFVLPLTFVSFYTAQMSSDLWFVYMLIIDSTYKVTLFYILMTPFLFPKKSHAGNMTIPLIWSFASMIATRALFVGLHDIEPSPIYAGMTVVIVLISFAGACVVSFLYLQQQVNKWKVADVTTTAAPHDPDLEEKCAMLAKQYGLTPREEEILMLLARNYRAPYIAEKLVLSLSTVKTHMRNLYGKLDVHSQAELLILLESVDID